jgi:hypothetical protein
MMPESWPRLNPQGGHSTGQGGWEARKAQGQSPKAEVLTHRFIGLIELIGFIAPVESPRGPLTRHSTPVPSAGATTVKRYKKVELGKG